MRPATQLDESALETFSERVHGEVLQSGDEGYDEARTVWNAMIDKEPAVIARCTGAADVITAVDFAREHELLLAVKGGGHNVAGKGVCEGGLMIDLSPMNAVRVDPDERTARVGPGVTMGELDHETQAFGLATPGGVISTTGVAGLTLGGGWGWLSRTHGLAIDNLRSVDMVTADGELVQASEDTHADLFWGIRGGGGNFGIVTSFEFDLYEVGPEVPSGLIIHPFEDAAEVLRFHQDYAMDAPREVCCYAAILTAPPEPFIPEDVQGTKVTALAACYSGSIEAGEAALEPLREFGDPIVDVIQPHPYVGWQQALDDAYRPGFRNYWKTQLVEPLPDAAIETTVEYAETMEGPLSAIMIEHLGGAISDVAPDATAFRHRNAPFSFNLFPRWEDPADDEAQIAWANECFDEITPYATEGVYVNFLSEEGDERVRSAYGENYDRLADLKAEWDPGNLFQMNQNIEPTE